MRQLTLQSLIIYCEEGSEKVFCHCFVNNFTLLANSGPKGTQWFSFIVQVDVQQSFIWRWRVGYKNNKFILQHKYLHFIFILIGVNEPGTSLTKALLTINTFQCINTKQFIFFLCPDFTSVRSALPKSVTSVKEMGKKKFQLTFHQTLDDQSSASSQPDVVINLFLSRPDLAQGLCSLLLVVSTLKRFEVRGEGH